MTFVICVAHLKPLPGSPFYKNFEDVLESALRDARAIEEGGADALIVENYGDSPFLKEVGKEVVACMSVIANEIRKNVSIGLGINVLRNDPFAAFAIAKASKADFVRINQPIFFSASPEGILEGRAGEFARYRKTIDCNAMVFADISVKHAVHFAKLEDYIINAKRCFADAFIITGKATGLEVSLKDLKFARENLCSPILAGSGVTDKNIDKILRYCDGVIVGSYIKKKGGVDVERVRKIVNTARKTL